MENRSRLPAVRRLDHPPHQRGGEAGDGVLEVRHLLHRQRREEIPLDDVVERHHLLVVRSRIGHLHPMLQSPDRKLRQLDRNGPPPAQRLRSMRGEGCGARHDCLRGNQSIMTLSLQHTAVCKSLLTGSITTSSQTLSVPLVQTEAPAGAKSPSAGVSRLLSGRPLSLSLSQLASLVRNLALEASSSTSDPNTD